MIENEFCCLNDLLDLCASFQFDDFISSLNILTNDTMREIVVVELVDHDLFIHLKRFIELENAIDLLVDVLKRKRMNDRLDREHDVKRVFEKLHVLFQFVSSTTSSRNTERSL